MHDSSEYLIFLVSPNTFSLHSVVMSTLRLSFNREKKCEVKYNQNKQIVSFKVPFL